jgi:DNA-binding transcriptional LysR family regulator
VIDDHIDVAVRIGALADSRMVATRVGSVRRVVCGTPAYLAVHGEPQVPADLSALACVTFDMPGSSGFWTFATPGSKAGRSVPIRARLSVNTAEAAIDACLAGVGVTRVLSYQAARAVEEGKLKIILADFENEPLPVSLIHPGQGRLPLKTRAFLDMAAPHLRNALAHLEHIVG